VLVAAGRSLVDDHDRPPQFGRVPDVAQARHHGQRGPENHQRAGPLDQRVAGLGPRRRHVLAEEHDVRLEHTLARGAIDDPEGFGRRIGQDRVAIRVDRGHDRNDPAGIGRLEPALQLRPRRTPPAGQADDPVQAAVEFGDVNRPRALIQVVHNRPRGLMQAVHVLGDDPGQQAAPTKLGDGAVAVVRQSPGDAPPAHMAAGPVPAPGRGTPGEGLVGHRRGAQGQAGRPAVVRDTGLGRQPGSAQHEHAAGRDDAGEHAKGVRRRRLGKLRDRHHSMVPYATMEKIRRAGHVAHRPRYAGPVAHAPRPRTTDQGS
jgi:hypothetical protein